MQLEIDAEVALKRGENLIRRWPCELSIRSSKVEVMNGYRVVSGSPGMSNLCGRSGMACSSRLKPVRPTVSRWLAGLSVACFVAAATAQISSAPDRDGRALTYGVVNMYYSPVVPAETTLTTGGGTASVVLTGKVGTVPVTSQCDLLVVSRMQCATINTSDSAYGAGGATGRDCADPTANCLAGRYEYIKAGPATTFASFDLTESGLTNSHTHNAGTVENRRTFQLGRERQYSSVTSGGNVQAPFWNGTTGRVEVLDVVGQLNLCTRAVDIAGPCFQGGGSIDQGYAIKAPSPAYVSALISASSQNGNIGTSIAGTQVDVWEQLKSATWGGYAAGHGDRSAHGNTRGDDDIQSANRDNGGDANNSVDNLAKLQAFQIQLLATTNQRKQS